MNGLHQSHLYDYPPRQYSTLKDNKLRKIPKIKILGIKNKQTQQTIGYEQNNARNIVIAKRCLFEPLQRQFQTATIWMIDELATGMYCPTLGLLFNILGCIHINFPQNEA